jgi:RHS repeat-associated protein
MVSYGDERSFDSTMTYDTLGRLATDVDPAGALQTLVPAGTREAAQSTHASGEGRITNYFIDRLPSGIEQRTNVFPDGTRTTEVLEIEGSRVLTLRDGTVVKSLFGSDPRWSQAAPTTSVTTILPSGLTRTETESRLVTLSNPLDLSSLVTLEEQWRINDRLTRSVFDAATRTFTITSPAGRQIFTTIDSQGRTTRQETPTVLPIILTYDSRGRLSTRTQGPRVESTSYDAASGYAASTTDALSRTTLTSRDALGRLLAQTLTDNNVVAYGWDAAGNLTSVTPPGRPAHVQTYTPVNLLGSYIPPAVPGVPSAGSVFTHDLDRMPRLTTRPDGLAFEQVYDGAGRLDFLLTPTGTYDYQYFGLSPCPGCAPGKLSRVTSPTGVNLDLTYDGRLITSTTWSGAVSGGLAFGYDTDFRVTTETVTAGSTSSVIRYGYDPDSLLVCASPTTCAPAGSNALVVTFAPNVARITQAVLGSTTETRTYNGFGELASLVGKRGTPTLYSEVMDSASAPRDALGRITTRVETTSSGTVTWQYTYDNRNRLEEVFRNGASVERFSYDANGNRTSRVAPSGTLTGVYDDQDRLLSYGPNTYTYTANGELRTKTTAGQTTTYTYDVRGNLVRVDLPGATVIEYLIDGLDRRVGKKRNGVLEKQWLYKDELRILAELDGAGALVSRFVYASRANIPDLVIRGGATYRVFSDHLGSPRVAVNVANGSDVPVSLEYTAFGAVTGTGAGWMPQGFAGGHHDADTGLIRFGARDFDSSTGRWTAKDPIRFEGRETNLYQYIGADPVHLRDLRGTVPGCLNCYKDCTDREIQCVFVCTEFIASTPPDDGNACEGAGIGDPDKWEREKKKCVEDCKRGFRECANKCQKGFDDCL